MSAKILPIENIVSDPKIRRGRPVVAGTGLKVSDVAAWHIYHGLSVEQIAADFRISLGDAHAALAYYWNHKLEIDTEIRENDAAIARAREEHEARKAAA